MRGHGGAERPAIVGNPRVRREIIRCVSSHADAQSGGAAASTDEPRGDNRSREAGCRQAEVRRGGFNQPHDSIGLDCGVG